MFLNKSLFFKINKYQNSRIKKNLSSGFSLDLIQIISQIFFAPLMIFFWGINNFGIWIFLVSIPNIILVFNLNFTDASIHQLTKYRLQNKKRKANEIFQNLLALTLINIFFFSIITISYYFLVETDISILNSIKKSELYLILLLLIISIYLNLLGTIFTTVMHSYGKLHYGYNVSLVTDSLSKFLIVFSGYYFNSLIIPAIIYLSLTSLKFFLNFYFYLIFKKYLKFSFKFACLKTMMSLAKLSLGHSADLLTNVLKNSGIIIIIGIFFEAHIVGYVATVKTLFYFFPVRFFGKLNSVVYYETSKLYIENKIKLLKKNLYSFYYLTIFLLIVYLITSFLLGPSIYKIWLNNKYELEIFLLLLILCDVFFFISRNAIISLLSALNKNISLGIFELILSIIVIFMFYYICKLNYSYLYGFALIVASSFISLLFGCMITVRFLKKI